MNTNLLEENFDYTDLEDEDQRREKAKEYRVLNKEKIKQYMKQYRESNKDTIKDQRKKYRDSNKDKIRDYMKDYRQANKEKIRDYKKAQYQVNKEKNRERSKAYYESNKKKIREQRKDYYENNKPKYAGLRKDQRLETITFAEALDLFKLPRVVGEFEEKDMTVAIGRFGPYVRHNSIFVSLKKEDDPMTITADRAIELIKAKRQADIDKHIKTFPERPDVQLLNGRWGPYLVIDKNNFKLPKGVEAASLTLQDCLDIAADPKNASKGNRFRKKETAKPFKQAAAKKTAPKKVAKKVSKPAKKTTATKAPVKKVIAKVVKKGTPEKIGKKK